MKNAFDLPNTLTINGEIYCSSETLGAHSLWGFVEPSGKLVIEGRVYSKVNFDRIMAGQANLEFSRSTGYDLAQKLGSPELAHEMDQARSHDLDHCE